MYDPLADKETPSGQPYPDSYWASEFKSADQYAQLKNQHSCDVLIIGAGFSGLSCAKYLSEYSDLSVITVDANEPGWGCSGRNAGFLLPGSGRLDFSGLENRFGTDAAKNTLSEYYQALETIQELMEFADSDCGLCTGGYLKIGHSKRAFEQLHSAFKRLPNQWRSQYEVVTKQDIQSKYISDYPNYGGIYRNSGQSINPFALVNTLANKLHTQSHNIFANSPVKQIIRQSGGYKVISDKGEIDCKNIVLTTNAYSLKSLLPGVTEKQFPVLSSVLVTRPLCEASASGWQQHLTAMDTRSLKYYFRLLPDNRILFGGRGAVTGRHANTKDSQKRLKEAFDQYFPNLSDLNTEYFWSGWVSVSADSLPHVTESSHYPGVYYATGYCGSGLSYACQAGKRLAQWISGAQKKPECPVYQQEIPAFPFTGFRRTGLHLYYAWHRTFS